MMKPEARKNLLFQEAGGETLVYDLERHRAHCLDRLAALLLKACDGSRDPGELAALVSRELEQDIPLEVVEVGLERLARARLVSWDPEKQPPEGLERRKALSRLALAGLALPSVLTLASPLSAQIGTRITPGQCKKAGGNLGRCCTNNKLCILVGSNGACSGPPC